MSHELIDLTLAALDQITAMLEEEERQLRASRPPSERRQHRQRAWRMAGHQGRYAGAGDSGPLTAVRQCGTQPGVADPFCSRAPELMQMRQPIRFCYCGNSSELGELETRPTWHPVPPLAELDPERCYVAWEIVLRTPASLDAIRDVFIFVEDCCELASNRKRAPPCLKRTGQRGDLRSNAQNAGGRRHYDTPDNLQPSRPAAKLDQFVNLVGELVTVQAR